jgi:hypothetical protein
MELYVEARQQNVTRAVDGTLVGMRGTRDGSPYSVDLYRALALEGRTFQTQLGSGSDPSAAMDAYDANRPELMVDVPDGTTIIPLFIQIHLQTHGASAHTAIALASRTPGALTANKTDTTIVPVRTDNPGIASRCTAYGTLTGDSADPNTTGAIEFWRSGHPVDWDVAGEPIPTMIWSAQRHVPPVIVGSGSLSIYASGTAPTGFIVVSWAELPESAL